MLNSTTAILGAIGVRCLCVTVVTLALASTADAQNSLPAGAKAYQLRNREAADIAPQLRTMLSGVGEASTVYVDRELNRLVVQGNAQSQQIAADLVGALDLPTVASTNTQPTVVAQAYQAGNRDPRELALALQKQFPDARVESDARTGQVIVLAAETTQRQIASLLGSSNTRPATAVGQQPAASRGYQLQNMTWREFETQLRQMWGQRLALSTTQTGEVANIVLASATGPRSVMQIDRRTNLVTFENAGREAHVWEQVARAIDLPRGTSEQTQLISVSEADPAKVQRAVALVQATSPVAGDGENATATVQFGAGNRARWGGDLVANLFQPEAQGGNEQAQPPAPQGQGADAAVEGEGSGLIGPVQIEFLEGMDAIMIRGHKRDVERVRKIIEDIERLSQETQPLVEVYPLEFVNSQAVTTLVTELYEEILSPRQGQVSIRALVEPNAILLIGREESIAVVKDLIAKLDRPMAPSSQFQVIRLKFVSALDAETAVRNFFVERPGQGTDLRSGLGTRVQVIADYRTNTLIVQASPRDLGEVKRLIETIDAEDPSSTAEVRVFKLRNSMAEDLAVVLQTAIAGDAQQTGQQGQQQGGGATQAGSRLPSTALEFMMLDQAGGRLLRSGVVSDVQVSADVNTNALIVRAPAKSMELIEALIHELDQMPDAEAQLKVFTIMNGDATSLAATLQQVFGQSVTIGQGTGGALGIAFRQPQAQLTTTGGENSLVPLTFAVDVRTNSVIASGSASDLEVVETLLLRLDEQGFTTNQIVVYRLKNNSSDSVAQAVRDYVTAQQQTLNLTVNSGLSTTLDQLVLQSTVISEPISNSVIVAASPRYMDSIMNAIRDLDVRPPMVMVQCLIAEVFIGDVFEFGVELGLQDDLLYDRGAVNPTTNANNPGFNFNNVGLPNNQPTGRSTVGSQGISDLGLSRTLSLLGSGSPGLVLSAASDSINILVRALEEDGRLQVLSRPQVMALNNQPAFIQVGKDIARFNGSTATNTGVTQSVVDVPTGLILSIEPRINDDGVVVMTVDADKSEQGSNAEGTTLSDGAGGTFVVPPINRTTAQTTISAKSGQTVVIGGLITKRDELRETGVPYLRDIPVVGHLFNFEAHETIRTELLIILTPYIVSEDEDYEMIKMMESQRMNWCLGDVVTLDGERGLQSGGCLLCSEDVPTLFPDSDPSGVQFASREHNHPHDAPQPTPIALPNEQAQGLQRSELSQQPHLQPLPQQTINAGYNQYGQPVYQTQPSYGAVPAAYVPSQQPVPQPPASQQRTSFKPSWFPFSKK
ncbi:MAG: general secretion pathway protein GspD [Planctomycetaceae bacterium]|nr:general secretion pathway protein GspD [Planctomycetaceae bacterium]